MKATDKGWVLITGASSERFIGFLIEDYAGNFPLWLAPDQVRVFTLNDDEALTNYAKPIVSELRANMVRVDSDFSATPFKAKISNAERLRVHTIYRDLAALGEIDSTHGLRRVTRTARPHVLRCEANQA